METFNLTKEEKQVLSVLNDIFVDESVNLIKKIVNLPKPIIEDMIKKFTKEGLIEIVKIPQGDADKDWYVYTSKVNEDMLDDDIRYKRHWGVFPQEEIVYPIEEENEKGRVVVIKAGKKWLENKVIKYEGFKIKIPKEVRNFDKLVFAVLSIEKGKEHDTYDLWLHAHDGPLELDEPYLVTPKSDCIIDAGGDIETKLTISKGVLKKWTRLNGREINTAFRNLNIGSTYNLLLSLPRTITITKYKVIIFRNLNQIIDPHNVCRLLFENRHPIDKK